MEAPRIVDESEMPAELDARIRRSLCACFPKDAEVFSRTRAWHGSSPAFSAVREDCGQVIAHVGVVDRTVLVGTQAVRVAGVMNVLVLPQHRGRGLSRLVMDCAMDEALRRGFDAGLLFCMQGLTGLYGQMGWKTIDNPIVRREDQRRLPLPEGNLAMLLPLRLQAISTGAAIDLCGNDW